MVLQHGVCPMPIFLILVHQVVLEAVKVLKIPYCSKYARRAKWCVLSFDVLCFFAFTLYRHYFSRGSNLCVRASKGTDGSRATP